MVIGDDSSVIRQFEVAVEAEVGAVVAVAADEGLIAVLNVCALVQFERYPVVVVAGIESTGFASAKHQDLRNRHWCRRLDLPLIYAKTKFAALNNSNMRQDYMPVIDIIVVIIIIV